ncbi:MAG: hypothetical protein ACPGJS_02355 [Flammeovirgaceae bacterium]
MIEENNLNSLISIHRKSLGFTQRLEQVKAKRERIQPYIRIPLLHAAKLIAQEEAQNSLEQGNKPLFTNPTQLCVHLFEQFIMRYRPDLVEKAITHLEK